MTWREYLTIASFAISVVSGFIAVASFRRTTRLQRFDYAPRIQLSDEAVRVGSLTAEEGFSYGVTIENPGSKPLRVDSVWIDYGSEDLPSDRLKHHVAGEFYLPPGGKRSVSLSLKGMEIQDVLTKFAIAECSFQLRVRIHTPEDGVVERTRVLAAMPSSGGATFVVPRGDILL